VNPEPLFAESRIAARVDALAEQIATGDDLPTVAAPVLVGAFVFAADLLRALARRDVSLPVEFLWLRSYAESRVSRGPVSVLVPPGPAIKDGHVLLIDGVLDGGRTLVAAGRLLREAGARRITTAVAVDKRRDDAILRADFAAFAGVDRFIVGYGMDDGGRGRGLPFIGAAD